MSIQNIDKKLNHELLKKVTETFFKEHPEFAKRYFEASLGDKNLKDFFISTSSVGITNMLIADCYCLTTLRNNLPLKPVEMDTYLLLIAQCLRTVKTEVEKYIPSISALNYELKIKLLEMFESFGLDYNKAIDGSYPNAFSYIAVNYSPPDVDFILSKAKIPLNDKTLTEAMTYAYKEKRYSIAQKIQKHRIEAHAKMGQLNSDIKEGSEVSDIKQAADRKENEDYAVKWHVLMVMEATHPGFMNKEKKPHNKELIAQIENGFIRQYGFHPALSDAEFLAKADNKENSDAVRKSKSSP